MILGNWITNIKHYASLYKNAKPFEYVIINNFFDDSFANELLEIIPSPLNNDINWHHYDNPIEQKFSLNKFDNYPKIQDLYSSLSKPDFIKLMKEITEINNLESDEYLHGAGIHAYPNKGKLDMHLDYNIHPISGKERRINLIIYMNKDWKVDYGGSIELYDKDMNKIKEEMPLFNTAIIFRTSDISYHGLPKPIKCPDNIYRKSIAIYYVSEPRDNLTKRYKAEYYSQINQPVTNSLSELYKIRKNRLITTEDLNNYYPNWRNDGNGFW